MKLPRIEHKNLASFIYSYNEVNRKRSTSELKLNDNLLSFLEWKPSGAAVEHIFKLLNESE